MDTRLENEEKAEILMLAVALLLRGLTDDAARIVVAARLLVTFLARKDELQ